MNEREEKIGDALLTFIDFLYAVVFGLIIAETFTEVVLKEGIQYSQKASGLLLVLSVFYFLLWDWLHGRLLTLKNPFRGYRRFFVEILIAFCGYGAASRAVNSSASFLVYIIGILLLGAYWARLTINEYPTSHDLQELNTIRRLQPWQAFAGCMITLYWGMRYGVVIDFYSAAACLIFGWLFTLHYEILIVRGRGLLAGPGVPFIDKVKLDKLREFIVRFDRAWRRYF